jgi:glycine oxidase
VKTWDAIVIGGGVIGLSIALELNKLGIRVLVLERSQIGREASHAAGGMLAYCDPHINRVLRPFAAESVKLYPELVHELEDETKVHIDLRQHGTIAFLEAGEVPFLGRELTTEQVFSLEPQLAAPGVAHLLPESSLNPRGLVEALSKSLHHRKVDISTGSSVLSVETKDKKVSGVRTEKSFYPAPIAINCAGAWASDIPPVEIRTRPVKGQMLSIVPPPGAPHFSLTHVVRHQGCYVIPRSDGRIVVGSTVEEAGYDKRVDTDLLQGLHQRAAYLFPELGEGRILEVWAGLRPGTPDGLPFVGETNYSGYLAATGHYRDGILLAPITARIIGQIVTGKDPEVSLLPFAPERFH